MGACVVNPLGFLGNLTGLLHCSGNLKSYLDVMSCSENKATLFLWQNKHLSVIFSSFSIIKYSTWEGISFLYLSWNKKTLFSVSSEKVLSVCNGQDDCLTLNHEGVDIWVLFHAEVKILFCPEDWNRVFSIPPASGSIFRVTIHKVFLATVFFFPQKQCPKIKSLDKTTLH